MINVVKKTAEKVFIPLTVGGGVKSIENINDFIFSIRSVQKRKVFSKLILKKLKRASYGKTNIGHYGLSFDNYIHFTSPIRRYADLYCHRLLNACCILL